MFLLLTGKLQTKDKQQIVREKFKMLCFIFVFLFFLLFLYVAIDELLAILTRRYRLVRKLLIQPIKNCGTFISDSFFSKIAWSKRAKALDKSSINSLIVFFVSSVFLTKR